MSVNDNRFETSDVKTRKRHEVVLSVNSPNSENKEMELSVCHIVHVSPSEKALEAKAQMLNEHAEEAYVADVEKTVEEVAEEVVETNATAEETNIVAEENVTAEETNTVAEEAVEANDIAEEAVEKNATAEEAVPEAKAPIQKEATADFGTTASEPALEEAPARKKSRFKLSLTQKKSLSGWLFVLPFVIGIIFVYAPIIYNSIAISLSDVKLVPGGMDLTWNNFANYTYLFSENGDPYFSITIVDGIKDLILQIPAIVIFALFMAIILNQKMTGRAAFRAIFFLPVILSTGIIDSIDSNSAFMESINNSQGGVDDNTGAESGGLMSAMDLESLLGGIKIGTELVDYVVSLVNGIFDIVSRSGVQMLIFLSGLQSISPAIYESCEVEGASAWETFWKITLPMISPMILVNAIYTVIDAFTAADNRVMVYIEKTYNSLAYAHSAAMSWVYVGVVLLFIVLVALIMKTVVFYQRRD